MKKVIKYPKNCKKISNFCGKWVNSKPKHRKAKKWILSGADLVTLAGEGRLVLYIYQGELARVFKVLPFLKLHIILK